MTDSLKKLRKTKQDFQVKQRRRVPLLVPGSQPLPPHSIMDADNDACGSWLPRPVPCACCLEMCCLQRDMPAAVTEDEDVYDCGSPDPLRTTLALLPPQNQAAPGSCGDPCLGPLISSSKGQLIYVCGLSLQTCDIR